MYTENQIKDYFKHISFEETEVPKSLAYLKKLQRMHIVTIPFESLSLHYSTHHAISLDYEDIFDKFVKRGFGGYCMEQNAFFGKVLQTLGYDVMSIGARVSNQIAGGPEGRYTGYGHMANLVLIDGKEYLVDVGLGAPDANVPLLLQDGHVEKSAGTAFKLELKNLSIHSRSSQKAWVFSSRFPNDKDWTEGYIFTDTEFFPEDYDVMNLYTSTSRSSWFVQVVVCQRMMLNEYGNDFDGQIIILADQLKRRKVNGETETIETFKSETDRVNALDKWFRIRLTEKEQKGIRGLSSELKG